MVCARMDAARPALQELMHPSPVRWISGIDSRLPASGGYGMSAVCSFSIFSESMACCMLRLNCRWKSQQ